MKVRLFFGYWSWMNYSLFRFHVLIQLCCFGRLPSSESKSESNQMLIMALGATRWPPANAWTRLVKLRIEVNTVLKVLYHTRQHSTQLNKGAWPEPNPKSNFNQLDLLPFSTYEKAEFPWIDQLSNKINSPVKKVEGSNSNYLRGDLFLTVMIELMVGTFHVSLFTVICLKRPHDGFHPQRRLLIERGKISL